MKDLKQRLLIISTIVLVSLPLFLTPTQARTKRQVLQHQIHVSDVVKVIDGDTIKVRLDLWPGMEITTSVRIRGIDAPETHGRRAKCRQEIKKGYQAKQFAQERLMFSKIRIQNISLGKYAGRVVADVEYNDGSGWKNFGLELKQQGLAITYGQKPKPWCY